MSSVSRQAEKLGDDVLQDWKQIGRGGFGAVYCARQKDWHFDVAIKMLYTNDRYCILHFLMQNTIVHGNMLCRVVKRVQHRPDTSLTN